MKACDLAPPNSGRGSPFDGCEARVGPSPTATMASVRIGRRVTGYAGRAGAAQGAGGNGKYGGWRAGAAGSSVRFIRSIRSQVPDEVRYPIIGWSNRPLEPSVALQS